MSDKGISTSKVASQQLIRAVDLFCGAGGLTRGLKKSGIVVNLRIEIDPTCEYLYAANNKVDFLLKSVDDV